MELENETNVQDSVSVWKEKTGAAYVPAESSNDDSTPEADVQETDGKRRFRYDGNFKQVRVQGAGVYRKGQTYEVDDRVAAILSEQLNPDNTKAFTEL